jgi:hypothetical protein
MSAHQGSRRRRRAAKITGQASRSVVDGAGTATHTARSWLEAPARLPNPMIVSRSSAAVTAMSCRHCARESGSIALPRSVSPRSSDHANRRSDEPPEANWMELPNTTPPGVSSCGSVVACANEFTLKISGNCVWLA